jgi:cation diffusion facilitator CzcD-associated flavoprotein CzcO
MASPGLTFRSGDAPRRRVFAAVVGTGFSGMAVAHELKRDGVDDLVLLERAPSLGGTWRDNTYPGCACDIPSHLYSFSFAPKGDWTRVYAPQPEIRAYLERCADALDLRRHVLFGREVVAAAWDEPRGAWRVSMRGGEELEARVLVLATGALANPALPALPGIERFQGARFHSARWEHGYDVRRKRVAVIGTGASAIQIVPRLQPDAERLFVVQRTPPWILPRGDRAFRGWERALLGVRPARWLYRQLLYWTLETRIVGFERPALMRAAEWWARRHMERSVRDPALRAKLSPSYRAGCKRILLSDDYYPAIARPNVEVVTERVREVGPGGLVLSDGRTIDIDALVLATGFEVHEYLGGLAVTGRGGATLRQRWGEGARAWLGMLVPEFPNLFLLNGPNTGLGHNSMIVMIEGQARWAARAIRLLRERGLGSVEVRPEAEAAHHRWIARRAGRAVWATGCRSWYLDAQGRNTTLWPASATAFRARTARLRTSDLLLRPPAQLTPARAPTAAPRPAGPPPPRDGAGTR